jgi:hypothetical protein
MKATVTERDGGQLVLELAEHPALYRISVDEHGLREIEFDLAQRRAMSSRCEAEDGRHRCAMAPHNDLTGHLCRGCDYRWPVRRPPEPTRSAATGC